MNSLAVLKTPGVARSVGAMKPEPGQDDEVAALQQVVSADHTVEPCDYFTQGTRVEVVQGPLAGLRGQLVRQTNYDGLVIRASLIQQAAIIHIRAEGVALL